MTSALRELEWPTPTSKDTISSQGRRERTGTGKTTLVSILEWRVSCVNQAAQIRPLFFRPASPACGLCAAGVGRGRCRCWEAVGSGQQQGILHGLFAL
jgi:hypothetical protein